MSRLSRLYETVGKRRFVITDSGSNQEKPCYMGKPCLQMSFLSDMIFIVVFALITNTQTTWKAF